MYTILYIFIWLITWLPLRVLYVFSDVFFLLIYYVIPYRKKIVRSNLSNSFPDKSAKELKRIERKFYRYFCDVFIETIYLTHMSKKEMAKRFDSGNPDVILEQHSRGKSVMLMTAHYGNWEWGSSLALVLSNNATLYSIYKELRNKKFGKMMDDLRSKFGGKNIETQDLLRTMVNLKKEGKISTFGMISDQSPFRKYIHYWSTFMNQDTPVLTGTEQLARKFDYPVVYVHFVRVKRGYYKCEYYPISVDSKNTAEYEITEKYLRILEQKINEHPEFWLWTHKRFKHKRNTETLTTNKTNE